MAEIQLNFTVTGNGIQGAAAQIEALKNSVKSLNQEASQAGLSITQSQLKQITDAFHTAMTATGVFEGKIVSLSSAAEHLGERLSKGKTTTQDWKNALQGVSKETGIYNQLAQRQVAITNSLAASLGGNRAGIYSQYKLDLTDAKVRSEVLTQAIIAQNAALQQGMTKVINWGKNMQWAGRQLTAGLTMPVSMMAGALAKMYNEVDQNLTRLSRVYGVGLEAPTRSMLTSVRKEVLGLSKELGHELGISAQEVTDTAAQFAAAGLTGSNLINATKQASRMVVLGETDKQQAISATISLQTAYGLSLDQVTEATNFFNAAQAATSTSMTDLIEAIPKVGPVVKGLGGSYKDMVAIVTALKEGGVPASEAANAIKNSLGRIINPTKAAREALGGFGINIDAIVNKNAGNLIGTLTDLQTGLDKLSSLDRQRAISELFGKFQFARMAAFMDNFNKTGTQSAKVVEMMGMSAGQLAGIADEQTKKIQESASGRFRIAVQDIKNSLLPMGEEALNVFTSLITHLDKFIQNIQNLPAPIKTLLKVFGGAAILTGPIIMLTGLFGNLLGQVGKGLVNLRSLGVAIVTGGVNPLKVLGRSFSLVTQDMIAEANASDIVGDRMESTAGVVGTLTNAINTLSESFDRLFQTTAIAGSEIVKFGNIAGGAEGKSLATSGEWNTKGASNLVTKKITTGAGISKGIVLPSGTAITPETLNDFNTAMNDFNINFMGQELDTISKNNKQLMFDVFDKVDKNGVSPKTVQRLQSVVETEVENLMQANPDLGRPFAVLMAKRNVFEGMISETAVTAKNGKERLKLELQNLAILKRINQEGFDELTIDQKRTALKEASRKALSEASAKSLLKKVEKGIANPSDYQSVIDQQVIEQAQATKRGAFGKRGVTNLYNQIWNENARAASGIGENDLTSNKIHVVSRTKIQDAIDKSVDSEKIITEENKKAAEKTKRKTKSIEQQQIAEEQASKEVVKQQGRLSKQLEKAASKTSQAKWLGSGATAMGIGMGATMLGGALMGSQERGANIAGQSLMAGGTAASLLPMMVPAMAAGGAMASLVLPIAALVATIPLLMAGFNSLKKSAEEASARVKSSIGATADELALLGIEAKDLATTLPDFETKLGVAKTEVDNFAEAISKASDTSPLKAWAESLKNLTEQQQQAALLQKAQSLAAAGGTEKAVTTAIAGYAEYAGSSVNVESIIKQVFDSSGNVLASTLADAVTQGINNSGINPSGKYAEATTSANATGGYNISNNTPQYDFQNTSNIDESKIKTAAEGLTTTFKGLLSNTNLAPLLAQLDELAASPAFSEGTNGAKVLDTTLQNLAANDPKLASLREQLVKAGKTPQEQLYYLTAAIKNVGGAIANLPNMKIVDIKVLLNQQAVESAGKASLQSAAERIASKSAGSNGSSGGGSGSSKALDAKIKKNQAIIDQIKKEQEERKKLASLEQRELEFSKTKMGLQSQIADALASGNFLKAKELQNELAVAEAKKAQEDVQNAQDDADKKRIDALEAENKKLQEKKSSAGSGGGSTSGDTAKKAEEITAAVDKMTESTYGAIKAQDTWDLSVTGFNNNKTVQKYKQDLIDMGLTEEEAQTQTDVLRQKLLALPDNELLTKSQSYQDAMAVLRKQLADGVIDHAEYLSKVKALGEKTQKEVDKWKLSSSINLNPYLNTSNLKINAKLAADGKSIIFEHDAMGGLAGRGSKYSMGGLLNTFAGGSIIGPGNGTSDSIPAMLSNGEFVIRAAAVSKYGQGVLNAINNGTFNIPSMNTSMPSASSANNATINANFNISGGDPKAIADEVMGKLNMIQKKTGGRIRF